MLALISGGARGGQSVSGEGEERGGWGTAAGSTFPHSIPRNKCSAGEEARSLSHLSGVSGTASSGHHIGLMRCCGDAVTHGRCHSDARSVTQPLYPSRPVRSSLPSRPAGGDRRRAVREAELRAAVRSRPSRTGDTAAADRGRRRHPERQPERHPERHP